ncbi:MAG: WD40/YVTN/BNR-like repeat-containing protein, partial [Candidatus Micrarchaeaceae archaeon]
MSIISKNNWFVILCAMVFVPTSATAQINWQITHESTIDTAYYLISALSGNGKFFTASARKTYEIYGLTFIFLRSNDGGMTWTEQDPGLPYHVSAYHDYFNVLDQIDSLNVVSGSKYGLILRTFDGGVTWEKQLAGDSLYPITDINFSDPMNGILTKGGYVHQIWTTSDGGRNWLPAPTHAIANQCHSTGPGHYKVFEYGNGPLYKTDDNWVTVDTAYVSDSLNNPKKVLSLCDFGSGDLMFAYGSNWTSPGPRSLIARTSDDGKTWQDTTIGDFNYISSMSDPDRDTIVAGGFTINRILISTDRGLTWIDDSSIIGDSSQLDFPCGIFLTADGHIV